MRRTCLGLIVATGLFVQTADAFTVYGVNPAQTLIRFESAAPGAITVVGPITGLGVGDSVIGMDFRPADGNLYVIARTLANNGVLYRIDTATAAATLIASLSADPSDLTAPYTNLSGPAQFGMDFNPVPDRIRLVGDDGLNLRVNPANGLVITDVSLAYAPGDANVGQSPHAVAVGYINNYKGTTTTTLYDIDFFVDVLAIQNPPNNGTLTTIGALGLDSDDRIGFDIAYSSGGNQAFASLTVSNVTRFYGIDLASGAATLVGTIGGGLVLTDIAVVSDVIFRNGFD